MLFHCILLLLTLTQLAWNENLTDEKVVFQIEDTKTVNCLQDECASVRIFDDLGITRCQPDCDRHIQGVGFYHSNPQTAERNMICRNSTNSTGEIVFQRLNIINSMVCYSIEIMVHYHHQIGADGPWNHSVPNDVWNERPPIQVTFMWNEHVLQCPIIVPAANTDTVLYYEIDVQQNDGAEGKLSIRFLATEEGADAGAIRPALPPISICVSQPINSVDCKRLATTMINEGDPQAEKTNHNQPQYTALGTIGKPRDATAGDTVPQYYQSYCWADRVLQ